ncbi:manganese efflux pump [candidate division WOR-3 bacterium]|nr:manganese efflux pump [candidate division WOR-3 bacterium]
MNLVVTLLLALGLALDAFAVSVSSGLSATRIRTSDAFRVAAFFGAFQSVMPVIGWATGSTLEHALSDVDHWIAFILLSAIGIHMIYESAKPERKQRNFDILRWRVLVILSVATSVDALIAGFSFAFIEIDIMQTVIAIGLVTFLLSFAGYHIGGGLGRFFRNRVRFLGGVILIAIGVKTLLDHMF